MTATPGGWELILSKANFVTGINDNVACGIVERRPDLEGSNGVRGQVILLTSQQGIGPEAKLRRIEAWMGVRQESMVFVTNHLKLAATPDCARRGPEPNRPWREIQRRRPVWQGNRRRQACVSAPLCGRRDASHEQIDSGRNA